jgi:hypothetical protein
MKNVEGRNYKNARVRNEIPPKGNEKCEIPRGLGAGKS